MVPAGGLAGRGGSQGRFGAGGKRPECDGADERLVPMDAVEARGIESGIAGEVGLRVAGVPHFEEFFVGIEDDVAVESEPPALPRLIGHHKRIGRMLAGRMKSEGHVVG